MTPTGKFTVPAGSVADNPALILILGAKEDPSLHFFSADLSKPQGTQKWLRKF
jgi:hypothetical protein